MVRRFWYWGAQNKAHFIVWALFVTYEWFLASLMGGLFPNPIVDPLHFIVNISFFYFHAHVLLPWGLKEKVRLRYLLLPAMILQLAVYILIHFGTDKFLIAADVIQLNRVYTLNLNVITRNLYRGIYFIGFSTGYYFLRNYINERKKTAQLEKERLEAIIAQQQMAQELITAQNAFLKAQINPHFLFNSLDFIYHKVNKHSEVAGEAVVKLADMMRFAVATNEMGDTIYLSEEIEQVENLLFLYQIRKHDDLNVHFFYSDAVKHLRFIPLVILTLVENIFKHGDISNEDDIAVIKLEVAAGEFVIQTMNLIKTTNVRNSTRAGLNNIKKRLNFAYGENLVCDFQVVRNHFKVKIVIPVTLLTSPVSSVKNATNNGT